MSSVLKLILTSAATALVAAGAFYLDLQRAIHHWRQIPDGPVPTASAMRPGYPVFLLLAAAVVLALVAVMKKLRASASPR